MIRKIKKKKMIRKRKKKKMIKRKKKKKMIKKGLQIIKLMIKQLYLSR